MRLMMPWMLTKYQWANKNILYSYTKYKPYGLIDTTAQL